MPDYEPSGLHLYSRLWECLEDYQEEVEEGYAAPEGDSERRLHDAMDALEKYALRLIASGVGVEVLDEQLASFMPGTLISEKVTSLLGYNLVQERLQFAVAHAVVERLNRVEERVGLATAALVVLLRAKPTETAIKYFERASHLYLAGYDGEVLIMCGAVLEAAAEEAYPDEALRATGYKPKWTKNGVGLYAIGQRMQFEKKERGALSKAIRDQFWEIVNWRNDAVHVQPDIGPEPFIALISTAVVLGKLLPRLV